MNSFYPTIKVQLDEGAFMPERMFETDAGADLRTPKKVVLLSGEMVFVDTGVHVELPPDLCARVESKSGLWRDHGILTTGLVDRGYSGSIGVTLINLGPEPYTFLEGEKIAQLTVSPVCTPFYVCADEVEGGERSGGGFGSSGRL